MGSQKRIAKVCHGIESPSNSLWFYLLADGINALQELAELIESPPAGISVELVDESNLYEWKVYMEGPEGSPYHVSYYAMDVAPGQDAALTIVNKTTERQIPSQARPSHAVSLQTADSVVRDEDLPSECHQ
jgi:hypothetical protein